MKRYFGLWLMTCLLSAGHAAPDCDTQGDIEIALGCLTGTAFREVLPADDPKIPVGYRRFELSFEQPIDHFNPTKGTFRQRLALLHKSSAEPIVLQTSGYSIFGVALTELAKVFDANQIQVEHRFFDQSVPDVQDWAKLDIVQTAMDFHRISLELKRIYRGRWVNTGASKGGMTSVFHHWLYPGDMAGTVADVAPLSFSTDDQRYPRFVEEAGGERYRDCRAKLKALQIGMLKRRKELMAWVPGSFVYLGGKSVSFEHAVIELPFAFWQYADPENADHGCANVPDPEAKPEAIMVFLEVVNSMSSYSDTGIFPMMPYYFQAGAQLGSPGVALSHLTRLHPYNIDQYMPRTAKYLYSNQAMKNVDRWARTRADHILFVYGEFDPWTAGAFPKVSTAADFHWFQVPGGNHSSKIFKLPRIDKAKALAVVSAWMGKRNVLTEAPPGERTLDVVELEHRRAARVP